MPHAFYPHRIWLYLILAAAMLASPLLQYTISSSSVDMLVAALFILTLFAYAEILHAAYQNSENSTHVYAAWNNLWQYSGWVALGALWIGRFAISMALAQHFHIYRAGMVGSLRIPDGIATAVDHISHNNGGYFPVSEWDIELLMPLWWQRLIALFVLGIVLVYESNFLIALTLFARNLSRKSRHLSIAAILLLRVGLCLAAVLGIGALTSLKTVRGWEFAYQLDIWCFNDDVLSGNLWGPDFAKKCPNTVFDHQARRGVEALQLGLYGQIDGGVSITVNILRPNLIQEHDTTPFIYQSNAYIEIAYSDHVGYYETWVTDNRMGAGWLPLRMVFAAAVTMTSMALCATAFRTLARRREKQR